MNESDAKAALRAMGIAPTRELIRNWLAVEAVERLEGQQEQLEQAEQVEVAVDGAAASPTHPSSKSLLEPLLREAGTLEKPPGRRKPGRPRVIACWFPKVAQSMADGTSLKTALAINGIHNLSKSEVRACYRNKTFRALYTEARRHYLLEHYGRGRRTLRAQLDKYV